MMRSLDALAVRETLRERIVAGVPFLGICLGMQALFEGSEEAPEERGLGVFAGRVVRFPARARVPHMGWNRLDHPRLRLQHLPTGVPRPRDARREGCRSRPYRIRREGGGC